MYGLALILPVLVFGGLLLYDYWVVMPDAAANAAVNTATESSHQLDDFVLRTEKVLTALAHARAIEDLQVAEASSYLRHVIPQFDEYDNLTLTSPGGMIVASALPEVTGTSVGDRPHVQEAFSSGQTSVSGVLVSRGTGRRTVVVAYPIVLRDGIIVGLLGATVGLDRLPLSLSNLELKPGYRVTVFDRQGELVFQAAPGGEMVDFAQCSLCHALPSPAGPLPNSTWQGNGQFHAISATGLGWNVVVTAPSIDVLGAQQRAAWMILGLVLVCLVSSLALGDWAGRRLISPILRLAESARRFGAGEPVSPLAATSRDEVGALTQAFNVMVTEIGEGRRRQESQQARLHTLWELDLAISSTLSLPGVLDIVAEEVLRHGSVNGVAVYLLDDAGVLAPVMSRGAARPLVTGRGERRLEDLAHEALLAGEPIMRELDARPLSSDLTSTGETISLFLVALVSRGRSLGVILFCANGPMSFAEDEREFLYGVGLQASTAVENARLYSSEQSRVADLEMASEKLKGQRDDLQRAQEGIMETLNLALQAKDPYTRGHAERVGLLSRRIAARLGLPREAQDSLARAARLHDIGKINIPEYLLNKEGALTPPERTQFELHPERSADLLRHLPDLDQVLPTIRAHHERYDGKGYPDGLAGDEIPLGARIIAAADAYDALTTDRPYRSGLSHEQAIEVLKTHAGTQWDPAVVRVLLESFTEESELGEDRLVSLGSG